MKSIVSILLVLAMLCTLTACGGRSDNKHNDDELSDTTATESSDDEEKAIAVAITVDGAQITEKMYKAALYQSYYRMYYEQNLYQYEAWGKDVWNETYPYGDDQTMLPLEEYIVQVAKDALIRQVAVQKLMKRYGVEVDPDDLAEAEEQYASIDEAEMLCYGLDKESYMKMELSWVEEKTLFYALYGEGGEREITQADIDTYLDEHADDEDFPSKDAERTEWAIYYLKYDEFDEEVKAFVRSLSVECDQAVIDDIKPKDFWEIDKMSIEDEKDPAEYEGDFRLVAENGDEWVMTDHVETVSAMWQYDDITGEKTPIVSLSFDEEGARQFAEATRLNLGKKLSIYIGDELISAPTVNAHITDGAVIITVEDYEEAEHLAAVFQNVCGLNEQPAVSLDSL